MLILPWRAETSNSRSHRKTSVLRPMISERTARIDDNLGRGTDGSNPFPSSAESAANFVFGREAWKGARRRQGAIPTVSTSSGTDGSNPAPSSRESVSRGDVAFVGREPQGSRGCARLMWRGGRQRRAGHFYMAPNDGNISFGPD